MTRIDYRSGALAIAAMGIALAAQTLLHGPAGGVDPGTVLRAVASGAAALGLTYLLERGIAAVRNRDRDG